MTWQGWLQIGLTLLIAWAISVPAGRYLARVFMNQRTVLDRLIDPVDNLVYRLIGKTAAGMKMDWKVHSLHMLATNMFMAAIIYLVLVFQDHLPLNPLHFAGMEPMLAFNTAISFITNTDWQNYGGETTLSKFSQMAAITFPMFTSAATGFVVAMAFIRAFIVKDGGVDLGNFYRDLTRLLTRILLPVSFVGSIRMSGVCAAVARAILAELPLARSAYPRDPHAPGRGLTRQEDGQQISSFSARPRLRGG
jgi:K+-transporting ATPase ATPase A chain